MRIAIVGEAWGKEELEAGGIPFVGASGRFLNLCLARVGINRKDCLVTNVFNLRPDRNDIKTLCVPKGGSKDERLAGFPAITSGKYIRSEYGKEVVRLQRELQTFRPNLIIALGGTATWALGIGTGIKKLRGYITSCPFGKVLPTYHPAAVLREYSLRPVILADLAKAAREAQFPEVIYPARQIWIDPTINDLYRFEELHILPSRQLSIDIETNAKKGTQITCIGFAPTPHHALVVPFVINNPARGNSYWKTPAEEIEAWKWVKRICALPKAGVLQNGLFDIRFLWKQYGIPVPCAEHDTMLLQHALQPEMEKGLGFLGSMYSNERNWKGLHKVKTSKKEDQ